MRHSGGKKLKGLSSEVFYVLCVLGETVGVAKGGGTAGGESVTRNVDLLK